jgi:hypothetical protein
MEMAHLRTPPRQSSSSRGTVLPPGLVTPSTPRHLSSSSRYSKDCPDAPFLPANFFPLPPAATLRTSPRTKKGDPTKPSSSNMAAAHVRTRTVTGDRGTIIQPGMPPTPAETPIQKRQREQEMKRRLEQGQTTTSRRLFPLKPVSETTITTGSATDIAPTFEIFTDSMHRDPIPASPNNPFAYENLPSTSKCTAPGISPKKRRRETTRTLGPHEMWYTFRGQKFVRKIQAGPNGEGWREGIRPVRLFQKEIEEEDERRRKRRRIATEDVEEIDTEEEDGEHDDGEDLSDDNLAMRA